MQRRLNWKCLLEWNGKRKYSVGTKKRGGKDSCSWKAYLSREPLRGRHAVFTKKNFCWEFGHSAGLVIPDFLCLLFSLLQLGIVETEGYFPIVLKLILPVEKLLIQFYHLFLHFFLSLIPNSIKIKFHYLCFKLRWTKIKTNNDADKSKYHMHLSNKCDDVGPLSSVEQWNKKN